MTILILIRHGQTQYNLQRKYCGFSDLPLDAAGVKQAENLAHRFKKIQVDKIYSSDLKRAYETAKIIFKNRPISLSKNLREINFGLFEGLDHREAMDKYPELYQEWLENPLGFKIPTGESLREVKKRVLGKISSLVYTNKQKTLAVVTHGGPIRIALCHALGRDYSSFWQMEQKNAAVNILLYHGKQKPMVVNDTIHLKKRFRAYE